MITIANSIRNYLKKAGSFLKKKQNPQTEPEKEIITPSEQHFDFIPILHINENLAITRVLRSHLREHAKYLFNQGFRDGAVGKKPSVADFTAIHAGLFRREVESQIDGHLKGLESLEISQAFEEKAIQEEYDDEKNYFNFLKTHYWYNENSFSQMLGYLYGIIGILIFLADIPLALDLISNGFSFLSARKPEYKWSNLFIYPVEIVRYNWQSLVTALGIALITTYLKIFFDEFYGSNEGSAIIKKRKIFEILHNIEDKELFQKDVIKRRIVKNFVFCLLLGLLLALSLFRFNAYKEQHLIDPNSSGQYITITVFFLMTILLPIVSGICFSLSLKTFQNANRKKSTLKTLSLLENKLSEAKKNVANTKQSIKETAGIISKFFDSDEFIKSTENYFFSWYSTGYDYGLFGHDSKTEEDDFISRIDFLRRRVTTLNTNEIIKKQIPTQ